jgi:alpha-L-arabinofuranosidase
VKNFIVSLGRIICLLLALPISGIAQSTTLAVDAAKVVRKVDERVFGLNAVMWDGQTSSAQTISLLKAADVRAIRLPGGSLSDEYHWRTNTTLANTWTWASGFNSGTALITGLSAQAIVTVNYGTGTPEEAAAWVAYANAAASSTVNIGTDAKGYNWQTAAVWANLRGASPLASNDGMNFLRVGRSAAYGIQYWEIGNENYGTWETDEQAVKNDPTTYANRAQVYMAKMKAVDPTIKIGVVAVTTRENASYKNWTPVMLARLKVLGVTPDFLIYHRYEQAPAADQPGNPESDASLLQKAKTWPDDAANLRQQLTDYLGATEGPKVEILVTENNSVYAKPGKQTTSLVNGLFYADSVGHLLQTEINSLMWWDLRNSTDFTNNNSASLYGWRNYGDYGILSSQATGGPATSYEGFPTYYAMKLLAKFARKLDTVVSATSNNSLLTVFAVKSIEGPLNLLVINKDPATSLNASITLTGYTPPAAAYVHSYGKTQDDAARTGTGSADIASTTMAVSGSSFSATFAPYSVTVISLDSTATPPAAPTPTPPAPTPTPPAPTPSSGGGGGGAPSLWFVGALVMLSVMHRRRPR